MARARKADTNAGGYWSSWIRSDKRLAIYKRDRYVCAFCRVDTREVGGPTLDHVDPDGSNDPDNLVVACRPCNNRKGAMSLDAFATLCGLTGRQRAALVLRIASRFKTPLRLAEARVELAERKARHRVAALLLRVAEAERRAAAEGVEHDGGAWVRDGARYRLALALYDGLEDPAVADAERIAAETANDESIPF